MALDQEPNALKHKKEEFTRGLPLLHTEDLSIQQFCDTARARFERCSSFDQFLAEHVERVIYDQYRVTVIGSVPIKMQLSNSQEMVERPGENLSVRRQ